MTSSRNTAGQILATSLIALVVMMFTGLALVQLADSANRTAEYLEKQTISAAHADAAYVYAQRKLDEAIDSGQLFADGDSDSGQVAGFAGPDAIWEWEVANTIEAPTNARSSTCVGTAHPARAPRSLSRANSAPTAC